MSFSIPSVCFRLVAALAFVACLAAAAAAQDMRADAERGDAAAQTRYGMALVDGGGAANAGEAARWFARAAEQGDAEAANQLGFLYAAGNGVAKDEVRAVQLFEQAGTLGHARARFNAGLAYATGRGVVRDEARAAWWFAEAERTDDPATLLALARLRETGAPGVADPEQARRLYRRAANRYLYH